MMPRARFSILFLVLFLSAGCASSRARPEPRVDRSQIGIASYYGREFHGRRTASGQVYDRRELTAAHRTHPFGTRVRVTNLRNGRDVVVTITDRGPFKRDRIIDVSHRAARDLGFLREGTTRVRIDIVQR